MCIRLLWSMYIKNIQFFFLKITKRVQAKKRVDMHVCVENVLLFFFIKINFSCTVSNDEYLNLTAYV